MGDTLRVSLRVRLSLGFVAGAMIAAVDNILFEGEVSPIVIVVMLLAATFIAGVLWGWRGWVAAVATWAWVPTAHLAKRFLGLPDTLHPNTYASILMLATFTLVVATAGTLCGLIVHQFTARSPKSA